MLREIWRVVFTAWITAFIMGVVAIAVGTLEDRRIIFAVISLLVAYVSCGVILSSLMSLFRELHLPGILFWPMMLGISLGVPAGAIHLESVSPFKLDLIPIFSRTFVAVYLVQLTSFLWWSGFIEFGYREYGLSQPWKKLERQPSAIDVDGVENAWGTDDEAYDPSDWWKRGHIE